MFPTEAVAMAWATLAELLTHLNVNQRLVNALEAQFGPFNDRIDAIASIPEHIWRTEVGRARYLAHAAVLPTRSRSRQWPPHLRFGGT